MARVHRCGDGCAEVNVAQPHHQIAGIEHYPFHGVDAAEAIDAADELDVAGCPRCVLSHDFVVLLDRQLGGPVIPGKGHTNDPRRHHHLIDGQQFVLSIS